MIFDEDGMIQAFFDRYTDENDYPELANEINRYTGNEGLDNKRPNQIEPVKIMDNGDIDMVSRRASWICRTRQQTAQLTSWREREWIRWQIKARRKKKKVSGFKIVTLEPPHNSTKEVLCLQVRRLNSSRSSKVLWWRPAAFRWKNLHRTEKLKKSDSLYSY